MGRIGVHHQEESLSIMHKNRCPPWARICSTVTGNGISGILNYQVGEKRLGIIVGAFQTRPNTGRSVRPPILYWSSVCGFYPSNVSNWLRGRETLSEENVARLLSVLSFDPETLKHDQSHALHREEDYSVLQKLSL
jgi:hypothetical protein